MSDDESLHRERHFSIASERTLDSLAQIGSPGSLATPVTSPERAEREMDDRHKPDYRHGSSRPPHHQYGNPYGEGESDRSQFPMRSWHDQSIVEVSPDESENRVRYDSTGFEPIAESPQRSFHKVPPELPQVATGSDSSPVRKLKRKEDSQRQPRVERELSDAYIESISRTPRYEFGRHNTYDEILQGMTQDDPFGGEYCPSGKSPREKTKIPKLKKKEKHTLPLHGTAETFPLENVRSKTDSNLQVKKRSKKKRKPKAGEESAESTATFTIEGHSNTAFMRSPSQERQDSASVKSNGTFTLEGQRKSLVESSVASTTTPVLKQTSHKVMSMTQPVKRNTEMDQEAIARFISDSQIKQRHCKAYVKDHKSDVNACMCGRDTEWHYDKGMDVQENIQEKHIWHFKTHSEDVMCDSFGEVQFQGFGQDTNSCSPYIRLCPNTDLEHVWTLLTEHWNLPVPKLLISVTGGAQRFDLNPRLKAVFKRGLINAATTTGAWIITGGTATGVMRFVGEAVRDHLLTLGRHDNSVIALGIATWGCIANRNALDGDGDKGLFPAPYLLEDLDDLKTRDVPLDHNHTHFLLVDDGTEGKFGKEIEFRTRMERYISEKVETGVAESQSVNVPVVMLVVEGGVNTMKTVWQAVNQNIPVLILNGSGRAADFIAYGYQITKDTNEDKSLFRKDFEKEMTEVAREKFAWKARDDVEKKIAECVKQLKDSLSKRRLINIFNLIEADTKDIDRAILYALLKANKTNASAQLALALAWNRCDIARHEIFTQQNRKYWKSIQLYDAMFTALVQDRVDFVHLFMENGVSLTKFLSIETLWNLYANVFQDSSDTTGQLLYNLLLYLKQTWGAYLCCKPNTVIGNDPDLLHTVGKVFVHLLGNEAVNPYTDPKFEVSRRSCEMKWLAGNHIIPPGAGLSKYTSADSARKFFKRKRHTYDFNRCPERELFFWAILFNRKEMAKMFWRMGQDQLGSALVACSILKAMSKIADDDEELELSTDLMEHANIYEEMAYSVLTECYKKDKMMAHQLLVRRLNNFGGTTLFDLADTNVLMNFMGHTCCQTKLNLIWKGRMALYTQTWKILLSLFIPLVFLSIKFTTNQGPESDIDMEDDFDDLEGDENPPNTGDEVHIISKNKVTPDRNTDPQEEIFVRAKSRRTKKSRKKLFKVQMFSDLKTESIGLFQAIYFFYTAPVTVFYANTVSYIVFLAIFSFFVLTDLHPHNPSMFEYITWGWTVTMAIEEIRQIFTRDQRSLWYKVMNWFASYWNKFDLAMYILFIMSVILRFVLNEENFVGARITYSVTLSMYYMRFMQVFFVEKNIGPKVIMIRNMLIDLMFFFSIFLIFLLSFGVAYQANLYPNSVANWSLLKSVIYIPYWQMYGELFLEDMEGDHPADGCTANETIWRAAGGDGRCPERNALVPLLAAVYLILTNILLVNLLIAMFSYTFQMVQDKSEQVWRFYRYSLVYEFYDRPMFCPPLIILSHLYRTTQWVVRKTCSPVKYHNEFKLKLDERDNNRLTAFVRAATENYLNNAQMAQREELNNKVTSASNRIEKVIEELDNIKEGMKQGSPLVDTTIRPTTPSPGHDMDLVSPATTRRQSKLDSTMDQMQAQISDLRDQMSNTTQKMGQLMNMVQHLIVTSQQTGRPSRLEIRDVTQYTPEQ